MTTRPQPIHARPLLDSLPIGRDAASTRIRLEAMERVMEGLFVIPGTNRKVGMDVLLGLVPFVGTTLAALIGSWLVWEARNLGMSRLQMARMFGNVGIDWALGLVPFVGAVPDFFFRSNTRNLRIIRKHLDRNHPATATIVG
ncbi:MULTISPECIES: DUF4112 domain-containing protein [unclassified Sphingomonas]|jgi:hypothetical protein|uniref:DUF4112 domain-containing protein n=1 Tax=unclassified Sphingomonas TaxID=196159 RepID=UPI0025FBDECC|nr:MULTISPECIES: DUF4112 domain-containing protein [unclassified Sphingomonas]